MFGFGTFRHKGIGRPIDTCLSVELWGKLKGKL